MLIGYFDLLGYHYAKGFFAIDDVAGSLGHYLNILSKRQVIKKVREIYRDSITQPRYSKENGYIRPFCYFDHLMVAVENYNLKIEKRNKKSLELNL